MKFPILFQLIIILGFLPFSWQESSAQSIQLSEKLKDFSKAYEVYFSYDVASMKGIYTEFKVDKNEAVEAALAKLLTPLQIEYEAINKQFYVLEKKKTSIQQLNRSSNQWSFLLLDETNLAPISDAFIFVENSSLGTTTDADGRAILDLKNLKKVQLVMTHLNYTTLTIPSETLADSTNLILLTPKILDLNEVVIGSKKTNSRKRRQWMRRFEEAFFGETNRRDQVELLNPEVLWFEENDTLFQAHAIDYLSLINQSTGYKMRFFLDDFKIFENQDVKYAGKIFFEDIREQVKNQRRVDKKRDQTYLNSKNLFFQSLIQELPLNEQRFEFGVTKASDNPNKPFQYIPLNYSQLNWRYGLSADTIFLEDYLTVINKMKLIYNFTASGKNGKVVDNGPATSFLLSKSGRFIISKKGYLLNPEDIEESGYWTSHRLATELPIDFRSSVTIDDQATQHHIIDSLNAYRFKQPQEKIYLHCNKNSYSNRENMWFKAYLVNAVDHRPLTQSSVVYIELINPEGEKIKTWMLHRDLGLHGDFQWNRNYGAGNYRLRAYTNYMRNADPSFFYEKTIPIYDFLPTEENFEKTSQALISKTKLKPEMVQFFPEGGDLVAGLNANVSFSVQDSLGQPIAVTGKLLDGKGQEITTFKSFHRGVGLFSFIPAINETYYAEVNKEKEQVIVPLPKVMPTGWSLQINPTNAENIFLDVACTDPKALEQAFLVGHLRGSVFCYIQQLKTGQSIQLAKAKVPEGVLHFTLFDAQGKPQAERLIYNGHLQQDSIIRIGVLPDRNQAQTTVSIPLQLGEDFLEEAIDVSATVTNPNLVNLNPDEENIQTYLLLNSDLDAPIIQPGQYLSNSNTDRFYLDLLMMCRGWRRFNWKDLLGKKENNQNLYLAEKGYTIRGKTTKKGKPDQSVQAEVMLNTFDENFIYKKIQTDEQGNFEFNNLPAMDSTQYILQGRINNGKSNGKSGEVEGNRLLEFQLSWMPDPVVRPSRIPLKPKAFDFNSDQKAILIEKTNTDEIKNAPQWQIDLDEVTIEAKRSYRSNRPGRALFYDLDAADWVAPTTTGTSLLAKLAPRFNFLPGPEGKLYLHKTDPQGMFQAVPVVISIDGMGADPQGSNAGPFLSLPADDIATIVISGSYIGVTTRGISRTREAYLESGILQYNHPAYTEARTFYTPAYPASAKRDLRTAVAWEPQVRFDASGQAWIPFTTSTVPGKYQVKVEGISSNGQTIVAEGIVSVRF